MVHIGGEPFQPRRLPELNVKSRVKLYALERKCLEALGQVLTRITTPPIRDPALEDNYHHNYQFILKLDPKNFSVLRVNEGRLEYNPFDAHPERAKKLIQQTIRQARGRIIDAQHGYVVNEKALYELNKLNEYVRKFLPTCVEKDSSSPVRILSGTYRKQRPPSPEAEAKALKIRKESDARIQKLVSKQRGLAPIPTLSRNKPQFVTISAEYVAIAKTSTEEMMGYITAACFGKDPNTEGKKFEVMGGVNELIASHLNVLLEGKFGIPLATRQGEKTVHAYADDIGSLKSVARESGLDKGTFLKSLPILPCQGFILGQLALGGIDCHAENVLFDPQMHPIAIDFGRSLGADPINIFCNLAACYLDWPAMDAPLSPEDLEHMKTLDIDAVMNELKVSIETQYADLLTDTELEVVLMYTFIHLEARLVTLQEAAREGMTTLREMTALFLPPIDEAEAQAFDTIKDEAIYAYLASHVEKRGFKRAFTTADPLVLEGFQTRFRQVIRQEISFWKGKAKDKLYGPSSERCYQRGEESGFKMDRTSY